jgi:hypothetical protein
MNSHPDADSTPPPANAVSPLGVLIAPILTNTRQVVALFRAFVRIAGFDEWRRDL